jgi:hypothetical protein
MPHKRVLILVLGGHLLILALIYLPFVFKHMEQLEIFVPGLFNLVFIGVSFVASLIASLVPEWRKYCGYWWLSLGVVLLVSVPVCLGTVQLNEAIVH